MKLSSTICATLLVEAITAAPFLSTRQAKACFVIGNTDIGAEVQATVDAIQSSVTCDSSTTTIDNVPDVSSGGITFSSINFAASTQTPLTFALSKFATATPLASTDLATFQDQLNDYLATEAGIRSVGGSLAIKVPKFFLQFQVARIQTAQGVQITDPAGTVDHQLQKVLKNAAGESQTLLDQVTALSTQLS